jgi:hypothetical protein
LNASETSQPAKRICDGAEEPAYKKLKFTKETHLAELNFVKRPSPQNVAQLSSNREFSSEAETEVDELIAKSSVNKAPKKYTFGGGSQINDAGKEGSNEKLCSDATKVRDAKVVPGAGEGQPLLGGRSAVDSKHIK